MQELCAGKMDSIKPENMMFRAAAAQDPEFTSGLPDDGRLPKYSISAHLCNAKQQSFRRILLLVLFTIYFFPSELYKPIFVPLISYRVKQNNI